MSNTTFSALSKRLPNLFGVYTASREATETAGTEFVAFVKPTELLISRWFPGYRVTDLTGPHAEEAIAILLGSAIDTIESLQAFQMVLSTPNIASSIIGKLLPRSHNAVKSRQYLMSEAMVAETVRGEFDTRNFAFSADVRDAVMTAYRHAITRVLAAKGLVSMGAEQRMVSVASSFTITAEDMRKVIMIEAMRGVFSESRIQQTVRDLDVDATPQIFGEKVGDMFRSFAFALPEIQLRLEQFDLAMEAIKQYNLDPNKLPTSVRAHPSLVALASIANFMVYASTVGIDAISAIPQAASEIRDACNAIQTVIASAPSIESIPISRFVEYFGEVPASSPDGFRRGLVMYRLSGQLSKMEVADVYPRGGMGNTAMTSMTQVDPTYVRAAGVAAALNGSILSAGAAASLANIVADDMALAPADGPLLQPEPALWTIGLSPEDIQYLALARAQSVAFYVSGVPSIERKFIYGCSVAEQWRQAVVAATPSMAFFTDPAAVLIYSSKMMPMEPKPMPSRSQTIGLAMMRDVIYVSDVERYLDRTIGEVFTHTMPVAPYGGEPVLLKMKTAVLSMLTGYDGRAVDRGTAFYASVAEPGVDGYLQMVLELALAYASLDSTDIQGDKAKSWLIVNLAPLMMHPAVRLMAERSVNQAVIDAKVDARRLAPQMREVYAKAFFGTALIILNRFGKIEGKMVGELLKTIPSSTLTLQASLTLAQIPEAVNGAPG